MKIDEELSRTYSNTTVAMSKQEFQKILLDGLRANGIDVPENTKHVHHEFNGGRDTNRQFYVIFE